MNKSFTNIRGEGKKYEIQTFLNKSRCKFPENEGSKSRGRGSSSFENAANTGTSMNQTMRAVPCINLPSKDSFRLLNTSLPQNQSCSNPLIRGHGAPHRHYSNSFASIDRCNDILKISSAASFYQNSDCSSEKEEIKPKSKQKTTRKIKKSSETLKPQKHPILTKILKKKKNYKSQKKDSPPLSDHAYYDDSIFEPYKVDSSFSFLGEMSD